MTSSRRWEHAGQPGPPRGGAPMDFGLGSLVRCLGGILAAAEDGEERRGRGLKSGWGGLRADVGMRWNERAFVD